MSSSVNKSFASGIAPVAKAFVLDLFTRIMLGIRIQSTAQSSAQLRKIFNQEDRIPWASTATRKSGAMMYGRPMVIEPNGNAAIPEFALEAFDKFSGFPMFQVQSVFENGYFCMPAIKGIKANPQINRIGREPKVVTTDDMVPVLPNDDRLYSFPVHNLIPSDSPKDTKGKRWQDIYIFVIEPSGNSTAILLLTVYKVRVSRGKSHFQLNVEKVVEKDYSREKIHNASQLESLDLLPVDQILAHYESRYPKAFTLTAPKA
jgi:hypothetical protein